jgi:hypothetical protein
MFDEIKNLDNPIKEMLCGVCKMTIEPAWQIRLSADECGQATDIIAWDCSKCKMHNITPDDIGILDDNLLI